ncbi:DUF411 domain-containing protein [Geoglobus sp.]
MIQSRLIVLAVGLLVLSGALLYLRNPSGAGTDVAVYDRVVTLYKTESCGCCEKYVEYLVSSGFVVNVVNVDDLKSEFVRRNVPEEMYSCHLSETGGYFVVGHVPVEAIEKLVEDKPEIRGIALPGMPPGSPGMPGEKQGQFVIFSLRDDGVGVFMRL